MFAKVEGVHGSIVVLVPDIAYMSLLSFSLLYCWMYCYGKDDGRKAQHRYKDCDCLAENANLASGCAGYFYRQDHTNKTADSKWAGCKDSELASRIVYTQLLRLSRSNFKPSRMRLELTGYFHVMHCCPGPE